MPHSKTQNCIFKWKIAKSMYEPSWKNIGNLLIKTLVWEERPQEKISELDLWRWNGWYFTFDCWENYELEVAYACTNEKDTVFLQVSCNSDVGFFWRFFWKKFIDRSWKIYDLAFRILWILENAWFTEFMWEVDWFPTKQSSSSKPKKV